jgi:hypothetical protein
MPASQQGACDSREITGQNLVACPLKPALRCRHVVVVGTHLLPRDHRIESRRFVVVACRSIQAVLALRLLHFRGSTPAQRGYEPEPRTPHC